MQYIRPSGQQPSFTKYFLEDPSLIEHVDRKQKKKIILYDLPQIQSFRKLNKPVVSQEKKRIIKEKLDLEQQSLLQTKQRQKRNEYFLNYSENPFVELAPHLKLLKNNLKTPNAQPNLQIDKPFKATQKQTSSQNHHEKLANREDQYVYDIVEELNCMAQKSPKHEFIKMKDDFRKMMKNANLFSNKIIELSSKKEAFEFFNDKKLGDEQIIQCILDRGLNLAADKLRKSEKQVKSDLRSRSNTVMTQQGKQQKKDTIAKTILDQLPENIMTFDEIICIKQENYFMKPDPHPQKSLNIFKISFNKNQKQIIGKQLLDKYNFSFTSMVDKLQKIKIPIYRDISRMARRISLNISTGKEDRFDWIDSYELSFKTNSLSFADLMSVASGRFTPEFVYKTTNFDVEQNIIKQTSQTSSQQEQEQIFYEDNTQNISVRFHNRGQDEQQILNYLKLQYNSRELNYKAQCEMYKQSIFGDLNMKEMLVSTTIQDKDLHGVINKSIKGQIKQFINMDEKDVEIDRLIRMNKMNKNKNVSIKLGKILEAFEIKKKHDHIIQKLGIVEEDDDSNLEEGTMGGQNGKHRLKLRPRKDELNRTGNLMNTSKITDEKSSRTPQKVSAKQDVQNSKTPQKRPYLQNLSKTPPKRSNDLNDSKNNTGSKNNTVKRTGMWKY